MVGDRHDITIEVMNGIFFVRRTGIPWRDLPKRYGPCTTCQNRWRKNGYRLLIQQRLQSLRDEYDDQDGDGANALRARMIDSSAVRAHRHAAGSLARGEPAQLGRSRGGMSTRIHAAVDGKGSRRCCSCRPARPPTAPLPGRCR